jgi:hypothetical protein
MSEAQGGTRLEFRHVSGERGQAALDRYEPVKIGFLGAEMTGAEKAYRKIHQLAFDRAKEAGRLARNVEMIAIPEHGLRQGSAQNAVRGYRQLVTSATA